MDLQQAIYTRRAMREFTSEPVDRASLLCLIDAAIKAPYSIGYALTGTAARGPVRNSCCLGNRSTMVRVPPVHLLQDTWSRSRARLRWPPVGLNQDIAAAESSLPLKHSFQ
jgi:hypothetical protein